MQHSLALLTPTCQVTAKAILPQLRDVPTNRAPTANLTRVIFTPPSHKVTAIPLEPTTRIFCENPSLLFPHREPLGRINAEAIQRWVVPSWTKFGAVEPISGILRRAVCHVLAAEDAYGKH